MTKNEKSSKEKQFRLIMEKLLIRSAKSYQQTTNHEKIRTLTPSKIKS
jgi:hypothetical protein